MRKNCRKLRLIGWGMLIGGIFWAGTILYSGGIYFYADDRLLCIFPWLAKETTIEELVAYPDRFAGNWVSVTGALCRCSREDATLIPPGARMAQGLVLPETHLYMHNFATGGIQTISVLDVPKNFTVTLLAEFEAATKTYQQHLDAVMLLNPRQTELRTPVIWRFIIQMSEGLFALGIAFFGLQIIRHFSLKNIKSENQHDADNQGNSEKRASLLNI